MFKKGFLILTSLIFAVTLTAQIIHETPIKNNLIINGEFRVAQRGTSFAAPASGSYTVDRWVYSYSGDMRHTITQDTDVPTLAQAGITTQYSLKIDCTTVDSSIAATDYTAISQVIEGYNIAPYVGRNLTLSFWVKATKTGTYCIVFLNSGDDRRFVTEYTIATANTWEKKTIIIPMNYSGGTWDYTNGAGLKLRFMLACGSDYQTSTINAWQTSNTALTSSNQVNACDSTDNNFWLANIKLEPGSVATKYEPRKFDDELRQCYRYFYAQPKTTTEVAWGTGMMTSSTQAQVFTMFKVTMRAVPTLTLFGNHYVNVSGSGGQLAPVSISSCLADNDSAKVYLNASTYTGTAWQSTTVMKGNAVTDYYTLNAEL